MMERIKTILGILWISLMCCLMAAPHEIGGAEFNDILSLAFWIMLLYIISKKHVLVAGILSTAAVAGISIYKFGWEKQPHIVETLVLALFVFLMGFMIYKLLFGKWSGKSNGNKEYCEEGETVTGLRDGSDEYWVYHDLAKQIYWGFREARTADQRRYYRRQAEELKTRLYLEYGYNDELVKRICKRFLDLRV